MPAFPSGTILAICVGAIGFANLAAAESAPAPVQVLLKDHRFTPAEIHLPSGRANFLEVTNADATPEEFEMRQLALEKVIVGGGKGLVRLRPLGPGRYQFIGEYNETTAHGTIIVDEAPKP